MRLNSRSLRFTDGVRSSARPKSRKCTSDNSFADEEAEICRSNKTACLASSHKMEKRPSKQTKSGRNSAVTLEIQGLISKSKAATSQKRPTKTRNDLQRLHETPDNGMMSRSRGRRIPTHGSEGAISKENPGTLGSSCIPKLSDRQPLAGSDESCQSNASLTAREDGGDGNAFPNETMGGASAPQKTPIQIDNSVFMDEDSNQPMPLGRFFENADLMQEIPPVVPAYSSMSRREFRKLHFKAKEDYEEEEEDDDYI